MCCTNSGDMTLNPAQGMHSVSENYNYKRPHRPQQKIASLAQLLSRFMMHKGTRFSEKEKEVDHTHSGVLKICPNGYESHLKNIGSYTFRETMGKC